MVVPGSSGGTGGAVVHWEFLQSTQRWQQEEPAEGNAWVILALHHLYITAEFVWVCSTDQFSVTLKCVSSALCLLGGVSVLPFSVLGTLVTNHCIS